MLEGSYSEETAKCRDCANLLWVGKAEKLQKFDRNKENVMRREIHSQEWYYLAFTGHAILPDTLQSYITMNSQHIFISSMTRPLKCYSTWVFQSLRFYILWIELYLGHSLRDLVTLLKISNSMRIVITIMWFYIQNLADGVTMQCQCMFMVQLKNLGWMKYFIWSHWVSGQCLRINLKNSCLLLLKFL